MEDSGVSYRFDRFTLEVEEHRLTGPDGEIYLRPKTFETLHFLLRHHGHLVTKESLFGSVWNGVAVTDNALTRCIKEIRKALEDDASNPRFLKTVPRLGYKFIGEVVELPSESAKREADVRLNGVEGEPGEGVPQVGASGARGGEAGLTSEPRRPHLVSRKRLSHRLVGGVLAVFAALTAVYLYVKLSERDSALGFQARDWVLIANFDNLTEERGVEVALRYSLEQELSFSRYVNYVPAGRVVDTLMLMKLDPGASQLTEEVAREVCLRDGGIRALISGSIQQAGSTYQIALKLIEPATGAAVRIFVEEAVNEEEILSALRPLARQLREALGESIDSIARSQLDLEKVTTPSLGALQAYTSGQRLYESAAFNQAGILFDEAISLDPEFASAHLSRALNSNILGRNWRDDLQKAAQLSDTVTSRERLQILVTHALFVEEDLVQADQLSEILTREFPDDYMGRFLAAYISLVNDDWDGYSRQLDSVQRTRPNDPLFRFWKGLSLLLVKGDWESAYREAEKVLEVNPEFPAGFPHFAGPCRAWMRGDLVSAEDGYRRLLVNDMAKLGPLFQVGVRPFISRFFFFSRDNELALKLLETSQWMVPRPADNQIAQVYRVESALNYEELGDPENAERLLREDAGSTVGMFRVKGLGWLGVHLARSGRSREAEAVRIELLNEQRAIPSGFFTPSIPRERERAQEGFSEQILGEIAFSKGDFEKAIDHFLQVTETVPSRGSPFLTVLSPRLHLVATERLAITYGKTGDPEKSIECYRSIIDRKSLIATTPASGQIWLRALRAIIPLLERSGRMEEVERYIGILRQHGGQLTAAASRVSMAPFLLRSKSDE